MLNRSRSQFRSQPNHRHPAVKSECPWPNDADVCETILALENENFKKILKSSCPVDSVGYHHRRANQRPRASCVRGRFLLDSSCQSQCLILDRGRNRQPRSRHYPLCFRQLKLPRFSRFLPARFGGWKPAVSCRPRCVSADPNAGDKTNLSPGSTLDVRRESCGLVLDEFLRVGEILNSTSSFFYGLRAAPSASRLANPRKAHNVSLQAHVLGR